MGDTLRYFLAVLVLVTFPAALIFWLLVHPLAERWRKLGAPATYTILLTGLTILGVVLYRFREVLLGTDLGGNIFLIVVGLLFYLAAAWIGWRLRRQLRFRILAGVPEISKAAGPGKLLQDGIYGVVRHPRYLSASLGAVAFALFINHTGIYLMTVAAFAALYLIIILEERELVRRFGDAYRNYQARVPRIIPRGRRR